jgi:hypothetical protein
MIDENKIIVYEYRPVENRGKKKARPLIENQSSYREQLIALLISLQPLVKQPGEHSFPTAESQIETMLVKISSLRRKYLYKARAIQ